MRSAVFMTGLLVLAGCSAMQPTGGQPGPSPDPANQQAVGPEAASPTPNVDFSPLFGQPGQGSPPPLATPASSPTPDVSPAPTASSAPSTEVILRLSGQEAVLGKTVRRLTDDPAYAKPNCLIYHYGLLPGEATPGKLGGGLRVTIKAVKWPVTQLRQADVSAVGVTYTQYDDGYAGNIEWTGLYARSNPSTTLQFKSDVVDGKLTLSIKGSLISDGGFSRDASSAFIDLTMRDLPL